MALKMQPTVLTLVSLSFIPALIAYSNEYTITVEAGKEDCFYTTVNQNVYLEVDYQVSIKISFLFIKSKASLISVFFRLLMGSKVN